MVVLNKDFCFHIVYVKNMLELGSGLVLGPMVHRIPNISGCFILYRFCICFHTFFVQNYDLVFQLCYVKIMLELDSGLLLGPRGPPDFRNFNKS